MTERRAEPQVEFLFVGEHLCLDFVNTQILVNDAPMDLLRDFDDVVAWAVAAKLMEAASAKDHSRRWRGDKAERAFRQAIDLRASLRQMAERLADGRRNLPQATLDRINHALRTPARGCDLELVRAKGAHDRYETRSHRVFHEPIDLLAPIAESAARLLSGGELSLVKKCGNPRCILYFYDTTRNHRRRWCSMTACGNRAKVAAHYQRSRQEAAED